MNGKPAPFDPSFAADTAPASPAGAFVHLDGEMHYRISAYHLMDPFLVSLASDTDLWMFVSSQGGLAAGRVDPDGSLFPYVTVDRLHDAHHHTGPMTLMRIDRGSGKSVLWKPFSRESAANPAIERNLYKNVIGTRLVFEEIDRQLGIAFRYSWSAADDLGWVRSASLENRGAQPFRAEMLDGLRNVLPYGAPLGLYQQSSNLVDAYKKTEVDAESGLGIYSLTAGITDRTEALEVLRANVVWCSGLEGARVHLSAGSVALFRRGRLLPPERILDGARGNYLVSTQIDLAPGASTHWRMVCDSGLDHVRIAALRRRIIDREDSGEGISASIRTSSERLKRNVGSSDGLQLSGRPESWSHHFANVLFNNMRGGVFWRNYDVPVADFVDFLQVRNVAAAKRHRRLLAKMPETITAQQLHDTARESGDPELQRLGYEYLPLHFGRRHGDPSRPWNLFSIRAHGRDGRRVLSYEGNWRDIFQNWEALGAAYPGFLPSFVAKFVNASTVDGFNPYVLNRDGVQWEVVSPEDPWSNIGYWGDHQIVYLLRLIESMNRRQPEALGRMLGADIFSYAEVPYRIKPLAEIIEDPGSTIVFDADLDKAIAERVEAMGTDGKLLTAADGSVLHVNLLEKLLVPALSKLSNLIPDAGIWMNTQRPEWNDANNALGGGGVSVVTLCYLRRYLEFLAGFLEERPGEILPVSTEVVTWLDRLQAVLASERNEYAAGRIEPGARKRMMLALGGAFSDYRETVYAGGFSGRTDLELDRAAALCRTALEFVDRGIAANRRDDGLYHSYNLIETTGEGVGIAHLPVMLEGQVAIIASGVLEPAACLEILEGLFASDLYRPDRRAFLLYPAREIPGFMDKNRIPEDRAMEIPLIRDLLAAGDTSVLARDEEGILRFQGDLGKADDLAALLDDLGRRKKWAAAVSRDRQPVLDLFELVFSHRSYTGRSGVMYGYEGLGCIYWHMVAKLLLAVQETVLRADREGLPADLRNDLAGIYFRIRSGLGYCKSVAEYGAFPTDPYSHTPPSGGAKQPGMTGQVKEEILTRAGELGIRVERGALQFRPVLLDEDEFLGSPADFQYFDVEGETVSMALSPGTLAFTLCQTPVVYARTAGEARIRIALADGSATEHRGDTLDRRTSAEIFSRTGLIDHIEVGIPQERLRRN